MYNKVKYLIYASLFIVLFLIIAVAQNSANKFSEEKAKEKLEQAQEKVEKYEKMSEERNKKRQEQEDKAKQENQNQNQDTTQLIQPNVNNIEQKPSNEISEEITTEETTSADDEESTDEEISSEKLYFAADKTDAKGYYLCTKFKVDNDNYAIIGIDDTKYISEYSKYINRKYYIYKQKGQELVRIHYLFDKSIQKTEKNIPEIDVEVQSYDVKITYQSTPPIVRTVRTLQLKENPSKYGDTPVLMIESTVDTEEETAEDTSEETTETEHENQAQN